MSDPKIKSNRRWTKEEVLREIRSLSNLSAKFNQRSFPSLYGATIRHFGSWKNAIEAAGFHYPEVVKRKMPGYWNKERLIEAIQGLPKKHSNLVRRKHADLYSAGLRLFGSWEKAVKAAGFNYEEIRRGWLQSDANQLRYRKKN